MITMRNEEENVLVSVFITDPNLIRILQIQILIIKNVVRYILVNNRYKT
jgi:hypothetical protein